MDEHSQIVERVKQLTGGGLRDYYQAIDHRQQKSRAGKAASLLWLLLG